MPAQGQLGSDAIGLRPIYMPDVIGLRVDDARGTLFAEGIDSVRVLGDDSYHAIVFAQDPGPAVELLSDQSVVLQAALPAPEESYSGAPALVELPDVRGYDVPGALAVLQQSGFYAVAVDGPSGYEAHVFEQIPGPGLELPTDDEVVLISRLPEPEEADERRTTQMPNVVGLPVSVAQVTLSNLDLFEVYVQGAKGPGAIVVAQNPAPGVSVIVGATPVFLQGAEGGPDTAKMPSVIGMSREAAVELLEKTYKARVYVTGTSGPGTVVTGQSPLGGSSIAPGAAVTIALSPAPEDKPGQGPAPAPGPAPTPGPGEQVELDRSSMPDVVDMTLSDAKRLLIGVYGVKVRVAGTGTSESKVRWQRPALGTAIDATWQVVIGLEAQAHDEDWNRRHRSGFTMPDVVGMTGEQAYAELSLLLPHITRFAARDDSLQRSSPPEDVRVKGPLSRSQARQLRVAFQAPALGTPLPVGAGVILIFAGASAPPPKRNPAASRSELVKGVRVPDVVGMRGTDARDVLSEHGFEARPVPVGEPMSSDPIARVVEQYPAPRALAFPGTSVYVRLVLKLPCEELRLALSERRERYQSVLASLNAIRTAAPTKFKFSRWWLPPIWQRPRQLSTGPLLDAVYRIERWLVPGVETLLDALEKGILPLRDAELCEQAARVGIAKVDVSVIQFELAVAPLAQALLDVATVKRLYESDNWDDYDTANALLPALRNYVRDLVSASHAAMGRRLEESVSLIESARASFRRASEPFLKALEGIRGLKAVRDLVLSVGLTELAFVAGGSLLGGVIPAILAGAARGTALTATAARRALSAIKLKAVRAARTIASATDKGAKSFLAKLKEVQQLRRATKRAKAAEKAAEEGGRGIVPRVKPGGTIDDTLREAYVRIAKSPQMAKAVDRYNRLARFLKQRPSASIDDIVEVLGSDVTFSRVGHFSSGVFVPGQHSAATRYWIQGKPATKYGERLARHELVHLGAALRGQTQTVRHEIAVQLSTTPTEFAIQAGMLVALPAGAVYWVTSD